MEITITEIREKVKQKQQNAMHNGPFANLEENVGLHADTSRIARGIRSFAFATVIDECVVEMPNVVISGISP